MEVDVNNPKPDENTGEHLKGLCHGIVVVWVTVMRMHTACGGDSSAAFFLQEEAVGDKCLHFVSVYHSPVQRSLSRFVSLLLLQGKFLLAGGAVQQRHGALALRGVLLQGTSSACWHVTCFRNGEAT